MLWSDREPSGRMMGHAEALVNKLAATEGDRAPTERQTERPNGGTGCAPNVEALPDKSKLSMAALAARTHWLTVERLPKYAPELNDIEVVWHDLKAHHLTHQTFADVEALDRATHHPVVLTRLRRPKSSV